MRSSLAIIKATALEILSEPLSLLLLLASLSLAIFAPAFHYHQFGDPTRMARDAGFSALLLGGMALSVFATIRAFRREIESGTLEMALSRPVSRTVFFLSKAAGAFVAFLFFAFIVYGVLTMMYEGAAIGGFLASRSGDIARVFGPFLAGSVAVLLFPLVLGAVLNRFCRIRFVLSAFLTAAVLSAVGLVVSLIVSGGFVVRLLPVALLLLAPIVLVLVAAAAFSVRLKANAAASCAGFVVLALLPFIGNYYLPEAIAGEGTLSWSYVACALVAAIPGLLAFLILLVHLGNRYGK